MLPENLHKKFYRPQWWREIVIPHVQRNTVRSLSQRLYSPERPQTKLMDEDWDNVIILDGCRYDLFEETNTLEGDLDYRTSLGSATREFMNRNFTGETHRNTVYVTANPMYRNCGLEDVFYEVFDVWADSWDEERNTVLPGPMAERTLEAQRQYPNKRIISQFMQPHYPFIGELAEEIGEHAGYEFTKRAATEGEGSRDSETVWERAERGELSHELVWEAYRENLEITFSHVERLQSELHGKTVVTSDHGNLLGERPIPFASPSYGHPVGVHCTELCKVPWLVSEFRERKEIVAEETAVQQSPTESDVVSDRLADLGYVDA